MVEEWIVWGKSDKRRKGPSESESARSESELLEEIDRGFPADVWGRYREFVAKRQAETLSAEEHAELIALIGRIELANVRNNLRGGSPQVVLLRPVGTVQR